MHPEVKLLILILLAVSCFKEFKHGLRLDHKNRRECKLPCQCHIIAGKALRPASKQALHRILLVCHWHCSPASLLHLKCLSAPPHHCLCLSSSQQCCTPSRRKVSDCTDDRSQDLSAHVIFCGKRHSNSAGFSLSRDCTLPLKFTTCSASRQTSRAFNSCHFDM